MKIKAIFFLMLTFGAAQGQSLEGPKKIDGTSLYCHTSGSGEILLVVHGGPGLNQSYFMPHLEKLSKNYKLIFYDQRASGKSSTPSTDSITLKLFTEDIEGIRKALGVEKINLLGHSWGVIPIVNYGIKYPDRVKKMILVNPDALSHEFDKTMLQNQQAKASQRDSTDRSLIIGSKDFRAGNTDAYRRLLMLSFRNSFYDTDNYSKLHFTLPANFISASKLLFIGLGKELENYNYYDAIKTYPFPVLILHGMSDAIPLAASQKTATQIPHSKLVIFKKSGHFIFIEENGKFTSTVRDFLDQ